MDDKPKPFRPRARISGFRYHRRETRNQNVQPNQQPQQSQQTASSDDTAQCDIAETQLKNNTFECMICCDVVRRTNPIWSCAKCFNIFHLKCAIEWCNKSIRSRNQAISEAQYPQLGGTAASSSELLANTSSRQSARNNHDYNRQRVASIEWPCPACREILYSRPGKYKCFCGKVLYPETNRHLTPHSCGQLCGRKRPDADCPHTCNNLCHPGRCAPCSLTSRKSCFCGKRNQEERCSSEISSCDQICGKKLTCGLHTCNQTCHPGSCDPCGEILSLSCNCGEKQISKQCLAIPFVNNKKELLFSCDKICDKIVDCGNHRCQEICHSGPCISCKLLNRNLKTCPCGATRLDESHVVGRNSCLDPIPTCGKKCNRALICGPEKNRHRCQKKCHLGECPPCKLKSTIHCECGISTRVVECALMFEKVINGDITTFKQIGYTFDCEARCNKPKNCGRHRCNNKCCKHMKQPQLHICDKTCNKKLTCGTHNCDEPCHPGQCGDCPNIGWEELSCHCGSSVLFPPIPCGSPRPACNRPCRRRQTCVHPVKHECHDDTENCPPCTVFVRRSCFCASDTKDNVYCYKQGYSCGRTCKKKLPCGHHSCDRICHDNECLVDGQICVQPCPVPRYLCKHPCGLRCHGKSSCPTSECKKVIEITCKCGNKTDRISCAKLMRDKDNSGKLAMMSNNRSDQGGILIDLTRNVSSNYRSDNESLLKRLDCDETCIVLERNKALAEALDITQPDLKPVNVFGEDPLKLIREATLQDYKFVSATYASLVRFVKQAKESEKRFIFMQFPPCERLRREIIHELAHHFHCTSESRGEEPFKQVIVRAYKNKSCEPDFTVEQLLPVSD